MTALLSQLKTWAFRYYYRHVNRKAWEGSTIGQYVLVSNLLIPVDDDTQIAARMYHGSPNRPLIVYFHGGGWVIGDLNTHDPFCRSLAESTQCTIMSLDYRLAPEHPFPAAHNDCLEATRWILDHLNRLAPNNGHVVIAGDSAGGNLTACTVASLENEPRVAGAIMIYPAIEHYMTGLPSYVEHAKTGPLTTPIMRWFMDTYLGATAPAETSAKTIFVSRRCDYRRFPRSLVVTAERDPLRDDGKRLGIVMRQAGVDIRYEHYDREAHGFACSDGPTEGHQHFIALVTEWLEPLTTAD